MSLVSTPPMSLVASGHLLRAVLRVSVFFGFFSVLAWVPLTARAEDACALKCVQRQSICSANCAQGERCREHCGRTADACLLRCQKTEEAREVTQQQQAEKLCFNAQNGQRRKCTAAEAKQLREDMQQATKFLCRDAKGEMTACPDQLKELDQAKQILERDCPGGTCKSDASN